MAMSYNPSAKIYEASCPNGQLTTFFVFPPVLKAGDALPSLVVHCFNGAADFTFSGSYNAQTDNMDFVIDGPPGYSYKASLQVDPQPDIRPYSWKLKRHGELAGEGESDENKLFVPRSLCLGPQVLLEPEKSVVKRWCFFGPSVPDKFARLRLKLLFKQGAFQGHGVPSSSKGMFTIGQPSGGVGSAIPSGTASGLGSQGYGSGTALTGTAPSGTASQGYGSGTAPTGGTASQGYGTGTAPTGTAPSGTASQGYGSGTAPTGGTASQGYGSGTAPTGTASGGTPSGTASQGYGTGTAPTGTAPPGTAPSGTASQGYGSGTAPTGTAPSGTASGGAPSGTASQGYGSGTAPTGTAPPGTAPSGTASGGAPSGTASQGYGSGTAQTKTAPTQAFVAGDGKAITKMQQTSQTIKKSGGRRPLVGLSLNNGGMSIGNSAGGMQRSMACCEPSASGNIAGTIEAAGNALASGMQRAATAGNRGRALSTSSSVGSIQLVGLDRLLRISCLEDRDGLQILDDDVLRLPETSLCFNPPPPSSTNETVSYTDEGDFTPTRTAASGSYTPSENMSAGQEEVRRQGNAGWSRSRIGGATFQQATGRQQAGYRKSNHANSTPTTASPARMSSRAPPAANNLSVDNTATSTGTAGGTANTASLDNDVPSSVPEAVVQTQEDGTQTERSSTLATTPLTAGKRRSSQQEVRSEVLNEARRNLGLI